MQKMTALFIGIVVGSSCYASDLVGFQGERMTFVKELKDYVETTYQVICPDKNFDHGAMFPAFNDKMKIRMKCKSGDSTIVVVAKVRTIGESYHNYSDSENIVVDSVTFQEK